MIKAEMIRIQEIVCIRQINDAAEATKKILLNLKSLALFSLLKLLILILRTFKDHCK